MSIRVLVAPLDWGLGHATRCIPVIKALLAKGCEVLIAGAGDSLELLQREFPQLKAFELPPYSPTYRSASMMVNMARQFPAFRQTIKLEHNQIEEIAQKQNVQLIISDNRYGCWSSTVRSVFISHQLKLIMPRGFGFLSKAVNRIHRSYINRFSECWIPDSHDRELSGELSDSAGITDTRFIGPLSRFERTATSETQFDILVLLSGPEPQRSILESKIVSQLNDSRLRVCIVRGTRHKDQLPGASPAIKVIDMAVSAELQQLVQTSEVVISRSGYSTVMDLATLGKKAIFIPTPGQTEQEYLARTLMEKKIALCMTQNDFRLDSSLSQHTNFKGFTVKDSTGELLHQAIDNAL